MKPARAIRASLALLIFLLCDSNFATADNFRLDMEVSPVWQSSNRVRIPNDDGDQFNLADFSNGPFPAYRIGAAYTFNERHVFRGLIAPLQLSTSGQFDREIFFNGETFSPDERTSARYKFNSYRLGYRYVFLTTDFWELQGGGALKVRDAKIELRQGDKNTRDTDIGLIPLLSARVVYRPMDRISLLWDVEGLGAPQGRAIDSLLGVTYAINPAFNLTLGYRTLEGGADNDSVYTFSWFHYGVISLGYTF